MNNSFTGKYIKLGLFSYSYFNQIKFYKFSPRDNLIYCKSEDICYNTACKFSFTV